MPSSIEPIESKTDVFVISYFSPTKINIDYLLSLIVGAGPAGLMAATWLARLGVATRIVDKRGTKIFAGQADGLQCRSLEIFDSFGFCDRVWKESNHMIEICMWVCAAILAQSQRCS
jgi:predicted oxidoreductase